VSLRTFQTAFVKEETYFMLGVVGMFAFHNDQWCQCSRYQYSAVT